MSHSSFQINLLEIVSTRHIIVYSIHDCSRRYYVNRQRSNLFIFAKINICIILHFLRAHKLSPAFRFAVLLHSSKTDLFNTFSIVAQAQNKCLSAVHWEMQDYLFKRTSVSYRILIGL